MKRNMNVHKGHRQRLKKRYIDEGLEHFQLHNILELLLFFGIPLKDTNVIAHDLIEKFGSFSAVFDADIESLKSVKNMTENAAILIKLMPEISKACDLDRNSISSKRFDTKEKIEKYLIDLYRGLKVETVYLLLFDAKQHLVDCIKLDSGNASSSKFDSARIVEIAVKRGIPNVVLAHNHPSEKTFSSNDIIATRRLKHFLGEMKINLIENYVVAGNKVYRLVEQTEK
ncbi:MAG: hypothetical protein IKL40_02725 [Clostridia bacterium]|nr:hypothetical protein [Clostridia bacterium]